MANNVSFNSEDVIKILLKAAGVLIIGAKTLDALQKVNNLQASDLKLLDFVPHNQDGE